MNYEQIVDFVKEHFNSIEKKNIKKNVAVEFDIYGEGEGAFYVETKNGTVSVEPYEYYDRDAKVIITCEDLVSIVEGKKSVEESVEDGIMMVEGDLVLASELIALLEKSKKTVEKNTTKKASDKKKTVKKADSKTASAKKKTEKSVPVKDTVKKEAVQKKETETKKIKTSKKSK